MKILIIYFSSSGNTKYVAQLIENGLKFVKLESELIKFNSIKRDTINFEKIEVLGIGAPIYAMSFTLNMLKWVKKLPIVKKRLNSSYLIQMLDYQVHRLSKLKKFWKKKISNLLALLRLLFQREILCLS